MKPSTGIAVKEPTPILLKSIKVNYKDFTKAIAKMGLVSQQSLKEVSVHSEACIVHTAKPSEMQVYQPTAKADDS